MDLMRMVERFMTFKDFCNKYKIFLSSSNGDQQMSVNWHETSYLLLKLWEHKVKKIQAWPRKSFDVHGNLQYKVRPINAVTVNVKCRQLKSQSF